MHNDFLLFLFLIFTGAAILSTFALYTRQSLLVAYMLLGIILGPWGLKWVIDSSVIEQIGNIGIIFLLFLLGLHLQPQKLVHTLKKVSWLVLVSSVLFWAIGFAVGYFFGFSHVESTIMGAAVVFSSTIIGLKLLPTTVLHHQHTGEMMIAVLLLQDLIAIFALLLIHSTSLGSVDWKTIALILLALPALLLLAFLVEKYILRKLFRKFNRIREYIFLLSIAWCLSLAMLSHAADLSAEIGAFIAGVSIASSPIAFYIAESLKPVRDFFLVLFFFAMGASFNMGFFTAVIAPAALLMALVVILKPLIFHLLFKQIGEPTHVSWEAGMRLGQMSEFSILLAYIAVHEKLLSPLGSNLIQLATMFTFIISSYVVIMRYPTPVAMSDKLRRD
jgi:Kef-type K+ transport system membrane component KefB